RGPWSEAPLPVERRRADGACVGNVEREDVSGTMFSFVEDLSVNPLLWCGLLAGLASGVACGVVGPYVVTRRIVFLSGAISHTSIGGLGAAVWLSTAYPVAFGWLSPMVGLTIAAVLSAILLAVIRHYIHERLDTLIGALWALGMSIGILFLKFTPGYQVELTTYLFGNIACVGPGDVWRCVVLDAVILTVAMAFHKQLLATALDREYLSTQGIPVLATETLLLSMVALTVIQLTQIVGMILVIALLSLPAATVAPYVKRMRTFFLTTTLLCVTLTTLPRMMVYGTAINPESAIVIASGLVYLISTTARAIWLRRK
ncbi:MAG: metal ABC transporter permease, partial [Planctomycetia bacterium]|nr:metal ABC transporter permease [Planctomycetia bacterium]